ncbi:hypothetical protein V8E36_002892 [Tilletia maclaganii]
MTKLTTLLLLLVATLLASAQAQQDAFLPLFILQGTSFASSPSSTITQAPSTPSITATIIGKEAENTTTYAVACPPQSPQQSDCPLPSSATFTLTQAPGVINQTYVNPQLQLTYTQHCALEGSRQVVETIATPTQSVITTSRPNLARCTLAFSGLPPSHSDQTLTIDVADASNYYRTIAVVADNTTATTTTTTTDTAPAVTSTSVIVITSPPAVTSIVTINPSSTASLAGSGPPSLPSSHRILLVALTLSFATGWLLV